MAACCPLSTPRPGIWLSRSWTPAAFVGSRVSRPRGDRSRCLPGRETVVKSRILAGSQHRHPRRSARRDDDRVLYERDGESLKVCAWTHGDEVLATLLIRATGGRELVAIKGDGTVRRISTRWPVPQGYVRVSPMDSRSRTSTGRRITLPIETSACLDRRERAAVCRSASGG